MPRGIYIRTKKRTWKIKDTSNMKGKKQSFKKGCIPWNKGVSKKLNSALDEWRNNNGTVWNKGLPKELNPNYGKKRSEAFRKKMSGIAKKRVENGTHNLWKGGVREKNSSERRIIMDSFEYKEWRKSVFERDEYTCQECKKRGGVLQADHIMPFSKFPELRLELSNGRTLCLSCHRKTKTYGLNKMYQEVN